MMVQQNLILILLLWCSGAEAPFKILLRWNSAILRHNPFSRRLEKGLVVDGKERISKISQHI